MGRRGGLTLPEAKTHHKAVSVYSCVWNVALTEAAELGREKQAEALGELWEVWDLMEQTFPVRGKAGTAIIYPYGGN